MKDAYGRVQLVQRNPRGEKELELSRVLTVAYLKAIRIERPDAFSDLVRMIRDVAVVEVD